MTLTTNRVTAAAQGGRLSLAVEAVQGRVTASTLRRTLAGPVVRYGDVGRTSAGPLVVSPGSLVFPDDLARVKLTREHERDNARGHLVEVVDDPVPGGTLRAALKVSDGPEGDAALVEAGDKTRDGFSFDVVDAVIDESTDPPTLTSALVIAIGQVGIPAFDDMRIDTIAASQNNNPPRKGSTMLTDAQRARLRELLAMTNRDEAQEAEFVALQAAAVEEATAPEEGEAVATEGTTEGTEGEGEGETVTASRPRAARIPAVPTGTHRPATRTAPRGSALDRMVRGVVAALGSGGGTREVSAALSDVTQSGVGGDVEAPAWSGELWSGLAYDPEFTPLLSSGDLTNYEGKGWRWVTKPVMADYAGDKAAIPSAALATEPASYEAARMAVGHDIDRKFYDFPNEANAAFLRSYVEAARESWAVRLDAKVEAWIIANAVDVGVGNEGTTLFQALGKAMRQVKRNKAGRASFAIVNDADFDDLIEVTNDDVPAFLSLFNVDPSNFTSSANVPAGTVVAGAKQAATVRTLPGSPIRVSAQHLANGGIDEAFFGYWAIEQHHETAIVKAQFAAA